MEYEVTEVKGSAAENRSIAEFLADFVREGGLRRPREGDDSADVWQARFRWWWDQNPFCEEDSLRGYLICREDGEMAGFHGFIPIVYEAGGDEVPSLIATTFFVKEAHREASIGMIARLKRLGREYQIVDGTPSQRMRELLAKMGYESPRARYQLFFPLGAFAGVAGPIMRGLGVSFAPVEGDSENGLYLTNDLAEVKAIAPPTDDSLRRQITRESLQWWVEAGSGSRQFFGLCDQEGTLRAYVIGLYKRKWGLKACLLMDYADWGEEFRGVRQIIGRIMRSPTENGLEKGVHLLTCSSYGASLDPEKKGLRRTATLYYQLPSTLQGCPRVSVPFEGDLPFL